jgi:hypothetical protein
MKIKTVIIFPNGSLSFYDKNLSFSTNNNNTRIQHLFVKKSDTSFFFSEDRTIKSNMHKHFLKNHKKYFK